MCGIIGYISDESFSIKKSLLSKLKRLEYRGYDSVGFATKAGIIIKDIGKIGPFIENIEDCQTTLGISHTRWSTHGKVTNINAHPHSHENIICVHNGIIENYHDLKDMLQKKGYHFETQTDTEIIPKYFHSKLSEKTFQEVIHDFFKDIQGTFAILIFEKDTDTLYALKRDSPLTLGITSGFVLASDIYAFSHETNKAIFFEDNEYAIIKPTGYTFYDSQGAEISKEIKSFNWTRKDETKERFDHYMIKEIKEQPETANRVIETFTTIQENKIEDMISQIKNAKRVVFCACGTSYHASLIGSFLFHKLGIIATTVIASEIENYVSFDSDTLVIALSQSGETMDVLTVLKRAQREGARIASIVNVPYSSIQRLSDVSIETFAGQEVCVAATKTFTNQLIVLFELARQLGYGLDMSKIPKRIQQTISINEDAVKKIAGEINEQKDIFVLGKAMSYPMSREIALKLKEIPYIHAEGMMAGELKHGTIALIEEGTPVIALIANNNLDMVSATQEVAARGARVIYISHTHGDLVIPNCCDAEFAIYAGIIGHLLSYYLGVLRGCEIDQPRNLAKSVTVR